MYLLELTSSPSFNFLLILKAIKESFSASNPFPTATQYFALQNFAKFFQIFHVITYYISPSKINFKTFNKVFFKIFIFLVNYKI